jgi:hypothetical protein
MAGTIVLSTTSAPITKSVRTLFDSLETSTVRGKYQVSLAECFLPLLTYSTNKICSSLLASSLADADSSDNDDTDDNGDDNDDEDTDDNNEEEDSKEEEEEEEFHKITNNNNKDNIMPPKLKEKKPKRGTQTPPERETPRRSGETFQLHQETQHH